MQTKNETPATVLVALMPEVKDWATLLKELWYRIPDKRCTKPSKISKAVSMSKNPKPPINRI